MSRLKAFERFVVILGIILLLILTVGVAKAQNFTLIEEYPLIATDVYHYENDRYVAIKDGRLYKNGELYKTYATDVLGERGLLSVCIFDGDFYVNVTSKDGQYQNILKNDELLFQVDYTNDPPTVPPAAKNHRGGELVEFGDHLFVSFGMGFHSTTSQNPNDYRGKIVEIEPFEHIVVTGLRNPWRFDYDGVNFWIADVGGNHREEITVVENFDTPNLGWPCWEGTYPHTDSCGNTVLPTYEYSHPPYPNDEASITGGAYYNNGFYFCDHYSGDGGKLYDDGTLDVIEFPQGVTSMDIHNDTLFVITWLGQLWAMPLTTVSTPEYITPPDASTQNHYFDILGRRVQESSITPNVITNRRLIYGIVY